MRFMRPMAASRRCARRCRQRAAPDYYGYVREPSYPAYGGYLAYPVNRGYRGYSFYYAPPVVPGPYGSGWRGPR